MGGVALLAGLVLGVRAWQHGRNWVGTDDAFLNAHVEQVSSRIAGRVESVPVRDNEFVRAGQLLVALDDRDLRVAIQQREAKLASAKADVTKAEAQALAAQAAALQVAAQLESAKAKSDNSEIELNRTKRLRETGAVAQQELDTAEKNELTDRAGVVAGEKQVASLQAGIRYAAAAIEVAKAAVAEAEADLATARLDLSYTTIVAKQEGRVTVKTVEPGNYVQPGQALMAVVSGDVWVEANYKETQLASVAAGSGGRCPRRRLSRSRAARARRQHPGGLRRAVQPAATGERHRKLCEGGAARAGEDRPRSRRERYTPPARPGHVCGSRDSRPELE